MYPPRVHFIVDLFHVSFGKKNACAGIVAESRKVWEAGGLDGFPHLVAMREAERVNVNRPGEPRELSWTWKMNGSLFFGASDMQRNLNTVNSL